MACHRIHWKRNRTLLLLIQSFSKISIILKTSCDIILEEAKNELSDTYYYACTKLFLSTLRYIQYPRLPPPVVSHNQLLQVWPILVSSRLPAYEPKGKIKSCCKHFFDIQMNKESILLTRNSER